MLKTLMGLLLITTGLWLVPPSLATELTYILEGTITQKNDPANLIEGIFVLSPVTYTMTINSETPNLSSAQGIGSYAMRSATLKVGGTTFPCQPRLVNIHANGSLSPHTIFDIQMWADFWGALGAGYFRLVDWDQQAIPVANLPTASYDLSKFEIKELSLTIGKTGVPEYSNLTGTFDSFSIIPEPASWSLVASASGLWAARRKRAITPSR